MNILQPSGLPIEPAHRRHPCKTLLAQRYALRLPWQHAASGHVLATLLAALLLVCGGLPRLTAAMAEKDPSHAILAVVVGTTSERLAETAYPEAELLRFDGLSDAVAALQASKADYVITSYSNCVNFAKNQDGLAVLDAKLSDDEASVAVSKAEPELLAKITALIEQYRADGTLAELEAHWFPTDGSDYIITEIPENPDAPALYIAISAEREPLCFVRNGQYTGLDVELARRLCKDMGLRPVFQDMKFSAMIPSVLSGKTPMAISNISATEERRESVSFSPGYFKNPQSLLTRAELVATAPVAAAYPSLAAINGHPVGVQTGTVFDRISDRVVPDSEQLFYNSNSDQVIALEQGKIAGFMTDEPLARLMCAQNPKIIALPELVQGDDYAFAFAKTDTGAGYRDQMNEYLAKLRADGTLDRLTAKWMDGAESEKQMEDVRQIRGENGMLRMASSFDTEPFTYLRDNRYIGFEMELLAGFCHEYGYGLEINNAAFGALIPGLVSGTFDVTASCITITAERAESIHFSDPIYNGGVVMVVRAQTKAVPEETSFFASLANSFQKNFIREDRWRLLASGIGITLLISICSAVLGCAVGFSVCMLRRNRRALPAGFAKVFIRVIQGTPIVVLLMILYYVVLNKTGLDGVVVAVIAFGVNFGAYAAEILRSGLDAVDLGQLEAAAAIGFSKAETFRLITLPQAARHFLPVLKGEFISLVKMTSVVGYVAVQDLTKASDIIRSRTYEAFFPLIVTAVLYFLLAWGLSSLLSLVEVKTDPKIRKRALQRKHAAKGEVQA